MAKKLEPFGEVDALIAEVENSGPVVDLSEIDDLCAEIDSGVDSRKKEVASWSVETKKREAADSQDPFVINLLALDGSLPVRVLAACNLRIPSGTLRQMVENGDDYIRMVVAHNPNCPAEILDRITGLSQEKEVLDAVGTNPNASRAAKFKTGHMETEKKDDTANPPDPVEEDPNSASSKKSDLDKLLEP